MLLPSFRQRIERALQCCNWLLAPCAFARRLPCLWRSCLEKTEYVGGIAGARHV